MSRINQHQDNQNNDNRSDNQNTYKQNNKGSMIGKAIVTNKLPWAIRWIVILAQIGKAIINKILQKLGIPNVIQIAKDQRHEHKQQRKQARHERHHHLLDDDNEDENN